MVQKGAAVPVTQTTPDATKTGFTVPSTKEIIITIDGPAGTGKSTVARRLAQRLGLDFLDTGAMYRAAAAILIDRQIDEQEIGELVSTVLGADLHFDWSQDPPTILAWDTPIDHRIRCDDVTKKVSFVATIPELRSHMVRKQRIIFAQHPRLVTEGRDQGSVAFPDAPIKFYLDADPRVRAERRIDQLGLDGSVSVEEMSERILERDRIDSTRSDGPLVCPEDAVVIDTSVLSIDEVINEMERVVRERLDDL
ncbi:MAG: cytidylate kinase [Phycisphaerae bacterium]|nr:cytidylate kinase [Phycisphaerae bacterium]MBM91370.1 cytidylate kinase [Phycisphaerae bacterium]HCT44776.1 (d)CMP kinase [Phycisphaerales bacterium]